MFLAMCVLVLLCASNLEARNVESRSVSRSTPGGIVNLVEINIRGVLHGRCIFTNDLGTTVKLFYEEDANELRARSTMVSSLDPVSQTELCRQVASRKIETPAKFRSGLTDDTETDYQLLKRLSTFQNEITANQRYVQGFQPRHGGGNNDNDDYSNIGVTFFGNNDNRPSFILPFGNYNKNKNDDNDSSSSNNGHLSITSPFDFFSNNDDSDSDSNSSNKFPSFSFGNFWRRR